MSIEIERHEPGSRASAALKDNRLSKVQRHRIIEATIHKDNETGISVTVDLGCRMHPQRSIAVGVCSVCATPQ